MCIYSVDSDNWETAVNPFKRVLLVFAATAMLLLAFTAVASAQTTYPLPQVGAGGASNAAAGGTQLPFTGSNHDIEFAAIGVIAVVVGGGLVVMTQRRRTVARV